MNAVNGQIASLWIRPNQTEVSLLVIYPVPLCNKRVVIHDTLDSIKLHNLGDKITVDLDTYRVVRT